MKEHINRIKENIDKFGIIKLIFILLAVFIIFQAGIFVGYYKARFYNAIGENYYRQTDNRGFGASGGMMNGFNGRGAFGINMMQDLNIPGGHGAVGKIVSINLPNIVVASTDNVEKTINISNDTIIRQFRDTIKVGDLKVGEYIVVLGDFSDNTSSAGNNGSTGNNSGGAQATQANSVINAKLIRLLPPPPTDSGNSVNSAPILAPTPASTSTASPKSF